MMPVPALDNREVDLQLCDSIAEVNAKIKRSIRLDRDNVDLCEKLQVTSMYSGVCSGLRAEDYPASQSLPLISDVRRMPLPPELVEQFGHMQCNCIIGIFPEIGRAWLTVDSDIFVWRYGDGDDLAYFDGLSETILSVALVQPKPGIFRDRIKYLLVLTTPLDIVLLGVSFAENDTNNSMHLLPDPLFTISSDTTYLMHTVGTIDGRIFTGGKDGCLYEIVYQAGGGWFRRKCSKINHSRSMFSFLLPSVVTVWLKEEDAISQITVDDTRNILYTRTEKGTLSVYDLGLEGNALTCVANLRLSTIQRRSRDIASGIEPSNLSDIIHISPITLRESRFLHLVAITQAGVRLYFITCQSASALSKNNSIMGTRPTGLHLVHVRLPPGFSTSQVQRPTSVHSAYYNSGCLLLASTNGEDGTLWCINQDMFAFDKILKETQFNFSLDGRSWAISEVLPIFSLLNMAPLPVGPQQFLPPDPPIHVTQHTQKPSEYVVITSQGCHMFTKLRPVDQLRLLLEKTNDPKSEIFSSFFKLYNNGEAACCCVIIAMTTVATDLYLTERAVAVFTYHGSLTHPSRGTPLPQGGLEPMSPIVAHQQQVGLGQTVLRSPGGLPIVSTPMPGYNPQTGYNFPNPALSPNPITQPNQQQGDPTEFYHSERQHGVYKMFSRLLRPMWEGLLVTEQVVTESGKQKSFVMSRVDVEVIGLILQELNMFKNFVEKFCLRPVPTIREHISHDHTRSLGQHRSYGMSDNATYVDMQRRKMVNQAKAELSYMEKIYELTVKTIQVLGLWRLLLHHQIHSIFQSLTTQFQDQLKSISFEDFVLNGNVLCSALLSVLVEKYIDDNSTIDALSAQLREICPSIYSPDDAICSKASELLSCARSSPPLQREEQLKEAASLFQKISQTVNLSVVVQQFQAVGFYTGAVELCMQAALRRDPDNLALKLYQSRFIDADLEVDQDFTKAFIARTECYKFITEMLNEFMIAGESHPQAPSVPVQPGPPSSKPGSNVTGVAGLQPEEAQQFAEQCLQRALKSTDELLHITLYDWMVNKQLNTQLLKVTSPFIETFLKRLTLQTNTGSECGDLLWKYYERNGQHANSAAVLLNLAERPGQDRNLTRRVEYLCRSKMNAKSVTTMSLETSSGGQLLHELEEKLEVAQIQLETLEQLKELNEHESVEKLNSQLMDVNTLYSEFAEPFQLAECKLAIVHCAGLQDTALVEALWQNIIEHELSKLSQDHNLVGMQMKISSMGRRYIASRYFPVEFLISFLEKISSGRNWEKDSIFVSLLDSGCLLSDLLNHYSKLHMQKLPCWESYKQPYHVMEVVNRLFNYFLAEPIKYVPLPQSRRQFVNRSLDVIAVYLVELSSVMSQTDSLRHLVSQFKRTQVSLEAMLNPSGR